MKDLSNEWEWKFGSLFIFFSLFIFNEYPFDGMFEFVFIIQLMEAADNNQYLKQSVTERRGNAEEDLTISCPCNY